MENKIMLNAIKTRLGITGKYHDDTLLALAEDVKAIMVSGGVTNNIVNSEASIGCVARGVADLWNYGAGDGKFSDVFYKRVIQLALPVIGKEDGSDEYDAIEYESIDNVVGDTPESHYASLDDIDDVTKGTYSPDIDLGEDYEGATKEEIDDSLKEESSDTSAKEEIDDFVEDGIYEGLTEKEIDGLF